MRNLRRTIECETTIRGGLPVVAVGVYVPPDPGSRWGPWPCPPEPECVEDVEVFWPRRYPKRHPLRIPPLRPVPDHLVSKDDLEHVEEALLLSVGDDE